MTDLDLDELDRLYAEASESAIAFGAFNVAIHNVYPALSARLRSMNQQDAPKDYDALRKVYKGLASENESLRAELEAVKREREELMAEVERLKPNPFNGDASYYPWDCPSCERRRVQSGALPCCEKCGWEPASDLSTRSQVADREYEDHWSDVFPPKKDDDG